MPISKVGSFMLYSLGLCHEQFEKRFSERPVTLCLSKADFIDLMQRAKIAHKKERALYKNMQDLEEQKYIAYEHRTLRLTPKGQRVFVKTAKEMQPYLEVNSILLGNDILKYTAKKQLVLRE
jgi:hypothetical protein